MVKLQEDIKSVFLEFFTGLLGNKYGYAHHHYYMWANGSW